MCSLHGRRVRIVQDVRGTLAQKFAQSCDQDVRSVGGVIPPVAEPRGPVGLALPAGPTLILG